MMILIVISISHFLLLHNVVLRFDTNIQIKREKDFCACCGVIFVVNPYTVKIFCLAIIVFCFSCLLFTSNVSKHYEP